MKPRPRLPATRVAAIVAATAGLAATAVYSDTVRKSVIDLAHPVELTTVEPVVAMPRTTMLLAIQEAEEHLRLHRPWQAWRTLEPFLLTEEASPGARLLAARAAAEWGGWQQVRTLLTGQEWLTRVDHGLGWLLLARAHEDAARWSDAAVAYRRFLALPGSATSPEAAGRLGRALVAAGSPAEAAEAFAAASARMPEIGDWLRVLEMEARVQAGTADTLRLSAAVPAGSTSARLRRARVDAASWLALGDSARAASRLAAEIRTLHQQGALAEAGELTLELARLQIAGGRGAEARESLRSLCWETALPARLRAQAAALLGEQPESRTAAEELARAAAYEAAGRHGLAARSLRAALAAGAPEEPASQLRLARLLFQAQDFPAARAAATAAAERLSTGELVAEAELIAARSRFRSDRSAGLAELRRIAERRAGTAASGTALFLLADLAARTEDALPLYRRAAAVRHAPESGEALLRLGDRSLRRKDPAAAIRHWEEYVERHDVGEETARLAYTVGMLHRRAGRAERATAMFAAAVQADPLSYYALRAGERSGIDPLDAVLAEPRPWPGLADDPREARHLLARLDALDALGLETEWKEELEGGIRRLRDRPAALIVIAEGLRDRERPVEAIRLGRQLLQTRAGAWDARLLRVVFPFPYRDLIESEAERYRIDPALYAGLIRQESTFRPAVRSRVGATGLAQIMPATGRWIAPRVEVSGARYEEDLLRVPEINARMGALYLADMLRRYDGAADLALAGYNAGPGRADRWRRELGYDRDIDAFRDAIPFAETRHYVKVVLRNAAVYRRLYGPERPADRRAGPAAPVPAE